MIFTTAVWLVLDLGNVAVCKIQNGQNNEKQHDEKRDKAVLVLADFAHLPGLYRFWLEFSSYRLE